MKVFIEKLPQPLADAYSSYLENSNSVENRQLQNSSLRELLKIENSRFAEVGDPSLAAQKKHHSNSIAILSRISETHTELGEISDALVTQHQLVQHTNSLYDLNQDTTALDAALSDNYQKIKLHGLDLVAGSIATQESLANEIIQQRSGATDKLQELANDHSDIASLQRMLTGGYGTDVARSLGFMEPALNQANSMLEEAAINKKGLELLATTTALGLPTEDLSALLDGTLDKETTKQLVDQIALARVNQQKAAENDFGAPIKLAGVSEFEQEKFDYLTNLSVDYPTSYVSDNIQGDLVTADGTLLSQRDRQEALNYLRERSAAAKYLLEESVYSDDLAVILQNKPIESDGDNLAVDRLGIEKQTQNQKFLAEKQQHDLGPLAQIAKYVDSGMTPGTLGLSALTGGATAVVGDIAIDSVAGAGIVASGINPEENAIASMAAPLPASLGLGLLRSGAKSVLRGSSDIAQSLEKIPGRLQRSNILSRADDVITAHDLIRAGEVKATVLDTVRSPSKIVDGLTGFRTKGVFNTAESVEELSKKIPGPKSLFFMDWNNMGPLSKMGGDELIDALLRSMNGKELATDVANLNKYDKALLAEFQGQANALKESGLQYEFFRTGGDEFAVVIQQTDKTIETVGSFLKDMERTKQATFAVADPEILKNAAHYAGTRSGMREILKEGKEVLGDNFNAASYRDHLTNRFNQIPNAQNIVSPDDLASMNSGELEAILIKHDPSLAQYNAADPDILMGLTPAVVNLGEDLTPEKMTKALSRADKVAHANKGTNYRLEVVEIDTPGDEIQIRQSEQAVLDEAPIIEATYAKNSRFVDELQQNDNGTDLMRNILRSGAADPSVPQVLRFGPISNLNARQVLDLHSPTTINAVEIDIAGFGPLNNQLGYARADEIYGEMANLAKKHFPSTAAIRNNGGGMILLGTDEIDPAALKNFEEEFKLLGITKNDQTIFESNLIDEHFAFAEHQQRQALNNNFGFNSDAERAFGSVEALAANNIRIEPQDSLNDIASFLDTNKTPMDRFNSIKESDQLFSADENVSLATAAKLTRLTRQYQELGEDVLSQLTEAREAYIILNKPDLASTMNNHIRSIDETAALPAETFKKFSIDELRIETNQVVTDAKLPEIQNSAVAQRIDIQSANRIDPHLGQEYLPDEKVAALVATPSNKIRSIGRASTIQTPVEDFRVGRTHAFITTNYNKDGSFKSYTIFDGKTSSNGTQVDTFLGKGQNLPNHMQHVANGSVVTLSKRDDLKFILPRDQFDVDASAERLRPLAQAIFDMDSETSIVIGRSPDADIILNDSHISRYQATVYRRADDVNGNRVYEISDGIPKSTNGTTVLRADGTSSYVNGSTDLNIGDEVRLADQLYFDVDKPISSRSQAHQEVVDIQGVKVVREWWDR